jgi:preprotein translocase subunit YajC
MQYILLQAATGATTSQGGFGGSSIIFMLAMFAILYFLMIRPQQKKAKETQKMQDTLQVNDKVLTTSGMYGRVVSLKPDKGIVVVEIDDTNKVRVEFQKSAILTILNIQDTATVK